MPSSSDFMGKSTASLSRKKKPSFFKILVKEFSTHLRIPPAFVKKFGKCMPNQAVLKVSLDKSWKVDVEKVGKQFFLKKGWEIFVKDNGLDYGDVLVFKYFGNSTFKVTIYGITCCEKEHHVSRDKTSEPFVGKGIKRESKDQGRWAKVEDGNLNQSEELKGAARDGSKFDEVVDVKQEVIDVDDPSSSDDLSGELKQLKCKERMKACVIQDTASMQKSEKSTTIFSPKTAVKFNSQYPYFQVTLSNSYVSNGSMLIPPMFCREHIKGKDREITLQISENIWTVKVKVYSRSADKSKIEARLSAGWPAFVRDNGLKMGDVCLFEMIKGDDIVFKVHIYRC